MGKKIDALLGRSFRSYKFKALVNLAISRLAVLKNQRHGRHSLALSDVVQLLNKSHHDRALLRVEQVIKEQNMLDVFVMIEGYCVLVSERVKVIENQKGCPEELKEAISGLIFAASRCGEFPELQEIRSVFTSRFGKEFTARAVELRNNCGVNPKMIQKLSTRQPSLEVRMKVLKEIADENDIALQLEEAPSIAAEEKINNGMENQPMQNRLAGSNSGVLGDDSNNFREEVDEVEGFSKSMNRRKHYKDVADAAQEAFMSAAYAAAAARAAVELSRSSPRAPDDHNNPNVRMKQLFDPNDEDKFGPGTSKGKSSRETADLDFGFGKHSIDSDHQNDPNVRMKQVFDSNEEEKFGPGTSKRRSSVETENPVFGSDKVHPFDKYSIDTETEEETGSPEIMNNKQVDSTRNSSITTSGVLGKDKQLPQEAVFDDSDYEAKNEKFSSVGDENPWGERGNKLPYFSRKQTLLSFDFEGDNKSYSSEGSTVRLNTGNRPVSVRTRR